MSQLMEVSRRSTLAEQRQFIAEMGESFARSEMMGCKKKEQGEILMMECLYQGVSPLSLRRKYHIIHGSISERTDFMLAMFHRYGGKSEIVERSPEAAVVDLTKPGQQTKRFGLTWEEAQQEPFAYEGKEGDVVDKLVAGKKCTIKDKYATPHSRMQMLWARVISDGVRAMMPEVNFGHYTADELGGSEGPAIEAGEPGESDVIDVESESIEIANDEAAENNPVESTEPAADDSDAWTEAQQDEILLLIGECERLQEGVTARLQASISDMTPTAEFATDVIQSLQAKRAELLAQQTTVDDDGPVTPGQIEQLTKLLPEVEQLVPGTTSRLKGKLVEHGLAKIRDLTMADADRLIVAIQSKKLEAFFEQSLKSSKN